jgi:hypothetical protein
MSLDDLSTFYVPRDAGAFDATSATAGPWGPALQHGGPPSALAVRALEQLPGDGLRIARVTVDILRPVPVAPVRVHTHVIRPGRRVQLVGADVVVEGERALSVTAWRVAPTPDDVPAFGPEALPPALPGPQPRPTAAGHHLDGYMRAVEWRFAHGAFDVPGPAAAWARCALPLVEGEPMSPAQRVVLLADSGNGVGTSVDRARFLSINTDLSVTLTRDPDDGWLCLESAATIIPGGASVTETRLSDARGAVGHATQTLLVDTLAA